MSSITPSTNVEDIVFELDETNAAGAFFGTTDHQTTSTTVAVGSDGTASASINIPSNATEDAQSTVTIKGASSGAGSVTCTVKVAPSGVKVGDAVNYSTKLNNVTLEDWKAFYKDGDYTWIILADYLPNSAVNISNISKSNSYAVYSNNRANLINAMSTTSNWTDLINNGKINGVDLSTNVKNDANVKAMGSPTLELWTNSWNAKYPNDYLYTAYANPVSGKTYDGWYVSLNNPATTTSQSISNKTGYSNTLYFPHTSQWNSTNGYWLASPSAFDTNSVMLVGYDGFVGGSSYNSTSCAFRPVVCLPSSVFE